MERVKIISLASLLVFWVGLLTFRCVTYPTAQRIPLTFVAGQKGSPKAALIAAPVPAIIRWPVVRKRELPSQLTRNVFAALPGSQKRGKARLRQANPLPAKARHLQSLSPPSRIPAPVVSTPPPSPPPPSAEEVAAEQARRQHEMAIQQARQQMTQYRFVGYLTTNGEPLAFVGRGPELFIVRSGDVLEGQVVVSVIDETSITLAVPTLLVTNKVKLLSH